MIFYYGLTDNDGKFTWMNLAKITTPENLKALGLALLLAFVSTVICLILAYPLAMILVGRNVNQSSFVVLVFILPMWMNFLLRTLAWQNLLEKNGVINSILHFFGLPSWNIINTPAECCDHQPSGGDHSRHGLQLPAVHGAADLQCTCKD